MEPTLYLMCGLPGSGKSARAAEMEEAGTGIVLDADSWVSALYPTDAEAAARDRRKGFVFDVQWDVAERLLRAGHSVILDWGFSKRAERDECRSQANGLGVAVRTVFLDEPLEVLHERVASRNRRLPPGTFSISPEELDEMAMHFERPTNEELDHDRVDGS